jgi:thiol-disulfide isomerase/thioredoxin
LQADADGNYQTCLAPGKYTIDGGELVVESQLEIVRDLRQPFRGKARLTGHVLDSKGEPVVGALVSGVYPSFTQQDLNTKTRSDGQFLVMRSLEPLILSARSPDGGEGSITTIDAEKTEVTLRLAPAASAVGKLVGETRQPVTDFEIRYGIKVFLGKPNENQWRRGCLGGSVKTDAEGRFKIPGLVIGQQYAITYRPSFVPEEAWCTIAEVTPREAGLIELGVTQALSEPKPYQPPTIEERTAEFFKDRGPLAERVAKAQGEARRCYLRVLVVMGDPASRASQKFLDARDHKRMNDYQWIGLAAASAEARAAIKRQFGDTTAELTLPALVALDESGDVLDKISLPFDGPDEPAAVAACNKFLDQHALPQLDAENLLSDALDRARREDKRVIVQETASWCGPCRMLTRFIDRHKAMFDEHFVYIKIDRERFRHGDEVMQRLRAKRSGIPWVVILDRDEKPLGFSEIKPGETYGFPTEPEEIDQFLGLLAKSAPRLPPAQEKELRADLEIKDRTGL